jgi:hypothetical protein
VAASSSYFTVSKSLRYSLSFALPLLVLYEFLAAVTQESSVGIRNGADVILKSLFSAMAGARGPLVFSALLVVGMVALIVRDLRRNPGGLRLSVFARMLAEAVVLALVFGVVVGVITAQLLSRVHPLAMGAPEKIGPLTMMTVSLGAGLYEELLFRVLLVGAMVFLAKRVLGLGQIASNVIAVVIGALVFSAFHYVGPYGDKLELSSFVFRAVAGVAFSGLYVTRGFGITAWTHALYDVFLLVAKG